MHHFQFMPILLMWDDVKQTVYPDFLLLSFFSIVNDASDRL